MVESAFTGLESVPWATLRHAYGSAEDVPARLRALLSGSESDRDEALDDLYASIWHQGTVYSATSHAVPFLAAIARLPGHPARRQVIGFLGSLASGSGAWSGATREAVIRELGALAELLEDDDPTVRRHVAWLLGVCHEAGEASVAKLRRRLAIEPDPRTAAGLLLALGTLAQRHGNALGGATTRHSAPVVGLSRTLAEALSRAPDAPTREQVERIIAQLDGLDDLEALEPWASESVRFVVHDVLGEHASASGHVATAIAQRASAAQRADAARKELAALLDVDDPILCVQGAMAMWHTEREVLPLVRVADAVLDCAARKRDPGARLSRRGRSASRVAAATRASLADTSGDMAAGRGRTGGLAHHA